MPRWAEMIVIAVIGIVLTGAIMVYAKFSSQKAREAAEAQNRNVSTESSPTALTTAVVKPTSPPGEAERSVPTLAEVEAAAEAATQRLQESTEEGAEPEEPEEPRGTTVAPAPTGVPAPAEGPGNTEPTGSVPIAMPEVVGDNAEAPAAGEALPTEEEAAALTGADGEPEGAEEGEGAEEEEEEEPEEPESQGVAAAGEPAPVPRGSREELLLLAQAERTLQQLHRLRLHQTAGLRARDAARQHAEKIQTIMAQLPEETRREMQAWIDSGYNAQVQGVSETEGSVGGAQGAEIGDREMGRVDDRPGDVRSLGNRIDSLSNQLGAERPRTRGPAPVVNPRNLPSARATSVSTSRSQGSLPSIQPVSP